LFPVSVVLCVGIVPKLAVSAFWGWGVAGEDDEVVASVVAYSCADTFVFAGACPIVDALMVLM
jgi:hypothetical protein